MEIKRTIRPTEYCTKIKYKAPFLDEGKGLKKDYCIFNNGEHDLVAQVKKKFKKRKKKKIGYLHLNKTKNKCSITQLRCRKHKHEHRQAMYMHFILVLVLLWASFGLRMARRYEMVAEKGYIVQQLRATTFFCLFTKRRLLFCFFL